MTKNNFLLLKLKKLIKALVYIVLHSFYLEHMGLFKVFQEHLKNYISTHFNPIFGLQLQRHFFIFWKAFVLYTYYGLPECFNLWFFFSLNIIILTRFSMSVIQFSFFDRKFRGSGAWQATVHGATRSQIWLRNWAHINVYKNAVFVLT